MKCHTAPNTTPVEAQARGLSSLAGIFGEAASVAAYIARSHPRSTLKGGRCPFLRHNAQVNRTRTPQYTQ
jgi:hypothetical protein